MRRGTGEEQGEEYEGIRIVGGGRAGKGEGYEEKGKTEKQKKPKADREKWKHGERGRRRYEWGRKDRVGRERRA